MADVDRSSTLKALQEEYKALVYATSQQNAKPRVAAWGLVKAGKSSLLNMLSGHVTDEYFETGAVRTTRMNQELETDQYILVDTPGLDIDGEDTQEAYKGLNSADVILFVHAPQGELDREEIDFLDRIHTEYGRETERRLIIVLTQLDKSQDKVIETIKDRVLSQIKEDFDIVPRCFLLSNTRYRKGAAEHKNTLVEKSGIPELAEHLDILTEEIRPDQDAVRGQRFLEKKNALLKRLNQEIKLEMDLILEIHDSYKEKVIQFNNIMLRLRSEYEDTESEIASAKHKLDKLQARN